MRRIVAFLAVLALVTGCGASPSDSLADTTWSSFGGRALAFHSDGTYSVGLSIPEDVADADTEWGTWSLDGDSLTMTPDATSPFCAGIPGTYTIEIDDDGDLAATVVDDDCPSRRGDFQNGLRPRPDTGA